jgi:hypothetical protein
LNICDLKKASYNLKNIAITKHARVRLAERGITVGDIQNAISTGEIIEQYENDKPFPSCLLLGSTDQNKFIHVVSSIDNGNLYVITSYFPNIDEWDNTLKMRKR